jgi:RimJ/RimL family protein N-acetyltransferase
VLRCWEPGDAPQLKEAVDASLDHLLPWMPWAVNEPQSLEEKVDLLRSFRGNYDLNRDRVLAIFDKDETIALGGTGMHPRRGPQEIEVGYWVRADRLRQGIATEAVRAIIRVAFEFEQYRRIEIRTDTRNAASRAIPEKLGFVHEATLRERLVGESDSRTDCDLFSLFRSDYDASRFGDLDVAVFDAVGQPIQPIT